MLTETEDIQKELTQDNHEDTNEQAFIMQTPVNLFQVNIIGGASIITFSAVAVLALLPAWVIALIVGGAALLLSIVGATVFYAYTVIIETQYANNPARAAATYGFPTYAALKASWPWYVQAVAC